MQDTEQKLREALQAAEEYLGSHSPLDGFGLTDHSTDRERMDALFAVRDALSLPTQAMPAAQEAVAIERVYQTIIHWDDGGKRSRRELARRIVDLYTTPQPAPASAELPDERDKVGAWQPIETAPKWESILIYQPKFNRVAISLNDGFEYKHATHWMPLPPPPSTSARDAAKDQTP